MSKESSQKFAQRQKRKISKFLGSEVVENIALEKHMEDSAELIAEKKKTKAVEEKLKKAEADKAELLDWLKTIKEDA